ncbi:hypothetical protein [Seleniivibrio woodruffii]|uniref:Uncharacterized protein n=1 Tax=Seleniivibrio woodruffii TaxID=1078050 RepID=A0A4R1KFN2_9BACT|nr:hypothetical protein [Seleniivibrio woodruffii]TCK62119.1 hypothetical protein C8D98_0629 [Seleniivibrio woodruffii]TVZ34764.1 hypothetical protein OF66_0363 [Seleniivibrio woodruffii]
MKTKDIQSMLGVSPSTFFEWNKPGNQKNQLAKLLKNLDSENVQKILNAPPKKPKPLMLLSTVNASIGDKKKHFTLISLKKIFYKKTELTQLEKYALKTIKNEALSSELKDFASYYKIPVKRINEKLGKY